MKWLIVIWLLLYSCVGITQAPKLKRKDKKAFIEAKILLGLEDYFNANARYELLLEKYPNYHAFNYGKGVCLLNLRDRSEETYSFIEKGLSKENMASYYWYGRSLHLQKRFDEAIVAYQTYRAKPTEEILSVEADRQIAKSRLAQKYVNMPRRIEVMNLGEKINSKYQDAVPLITSDESVIYFTSRRDLGSSEDKDPTGQNFQDIYYAEMEGDNWSKPKNIGTLVNSPTHDATVGISGNGNLMITYRTNPNVVGGDLYITQNVNGEWAVPQKLGATINSDYQEPCATITSDESVMYFSSNRPGGFGGMDLYRVKKLPNGEWSLPINLGPQINTAYDEDAPFIAATGKSLYFSSSGHPGIGGYDVFVAELKDDRSWTTPKNLGYPINTVDHDIYFTINAEERVAYYSSDMAGGYGDQDLYKIVFHDKLEDLAVIRGTIKDEEGRAVNAKITVLETNPERVNGIYRSNASKGTFITLLYPGEVFQLIIEAEGYKPDVRYIDLLGAENKGQAEDIIGEQQIILKQE